jgi:hypothetical protein
MSLEVSDPYGLTALGEERGRSSSRNCRNAVGVMRTVCAPATGSAVVTRRRAARLLRLLVVASLIAVVVVATATADSPACTHGVSSVGPVTIVHGHVGGAATPHTEACLK